jgi:hypothetical protein
MDTKSHDMSQGALANKSGAAQEAIIQRHLNAAGYVELSRQQTAVHERAGVGGRSIADMARHSPAVGTYARQAAFEQTIYGSSWALDFVVVHPTKFPNGLVIEVKYQGVGGSVDEKLPFSMLSLAAITRRGHDAPKTLLIIAGDGMRGDAKLWAIDYGIMHLVDVVVSETALRDWVATNF